MLSIRIVGAGAAFSMFLSLAVASATAQTPGAPLQLLQFDHKSKTEVHSHPKPAARVAKRTHTRRRIAQHMVAKAHEATAEAHRTAAPAVAAAPSPTAALAQSHWPATDAASQGAIAPGQAPTAGMATLGPQPAPGSVANEAVIDTDPNEILGNEHTVQTAAPTQVNPFDAAARAPQESAKTVAPASAPEPAPAPAGSAAAAPMVRAMVARPAAENGHASNSVGSASWIAQVLAALGGVIAAGAVAWFLIRPAPERTYG